MAIRAIILNVIREALRQKIIYVTILFTFLLFGIEPMLPSFQVGLRIQLFNDIALGISYLAVAILAVALSVNQLPSEIEKRTIYNVFSKPVRRIEFLVGKFLGVQIVLFSCVVLMGIAISLFTFIFFETFQTGLLQGICIEFMEGAIISSFAILMSTFVSPTVNVFACILFYFAGHVKNSIMSGVANSGGLNGMLGKIIYYCLPSLENFNVNEAVARGMTLKTVLVAELAVYAIVFVAIFLSIASLILSKKEL
jgi:ABC-type transport system involved in multi-copper enzyme maturation permease subunit